MNDAELRRGIAEWFGNAQKVAHLLNKLNADIYTWYEFRLERCNRNSSLTTESTAISSEEKVRDWLRVRHEANYRRIVENLQSVSDLIARNESDKDDWLGDRLLSAFPALGFFESRNKRWGYAWDRLLGAHGVLVALWPELERHVENNFHGGRKLNELRGEEIDISANLAICVGAGVLSEADMQVIEERLFAEMAQVLRDLSSENHTQNPQNTPGNESPKPEIDTQNPQITDEPFRVELDEDSRVFYFGTETFDRLTERIVSFLRVFVENWKDGNKVMKVGEINKRAKQNTTSGFLDDAFKVNRKNETIHRVSTIIEQVSDGYYRFCDPRKAKN